MRKISVCILILVITIGFFAPTIQVRAQEDTKYILLEPIPCYQEEEGVCENGQLIAFDPTTDTGNNKLGVYLNIIIKLFIGLCAVAAVVMIVIAGVEYSTSELISSKEAAKERIRNAILGLLLALGSYTLLYTINPDLLNTDVDIGGSSINSEGEMLVNDLVEAPVVGPGATVNGKKVGIRAGVAAPCTGGVVTIGNKVPSTNKNAYICADVLAKLQELHANFKNFTVMSTIRNWGKSNCHYMNKTSQKGNCADIVVTNGATWDDLCVALTKVSGINFANEAVKSGKCADITPYCYKCDAHGQNLHVNFTGGNTNYNQSSQNQSGRAGCQVILPNGQFGPIITSQTESECLARNRSDNPNRYQWLGR